MIRFFNAIRAYVLVGLWIVVPISVNFGQQPVLGDPTRARNSVSTPDNYLVTHDGYILSYNRSRGAPNWVTWHLSGSDLGDAERSNSFRADPLLPSNWRVTKADYNNSGFDRGHMCPSEDRGATVGKNKETFLMSNMQPQFHRLNGGPWKSLEAYVQGLVRSGFEAYLFAGCYGGDRTLNGNGKITIPTNCWKIVVLLNEGRNDLRRISRSTRVIAVDMPNSTTISGGWRDFRTTVDKLEEQTGFDFLSKVRDEIEDIIEARVDTD